MEESLEDQIQKRMAELPEDVQAAIASSDFDKKVQAVGQKHALHVDQIGKLGDEVMLVMLGFMKTEDFIANVAREVGVDGEKAGQIAADINAEILLPVRESLKTIVVKPMTSAAAAPSPVPVAPAPAPLKAETPTVHPGDMMLSQKTVTIPPLPATIPAPLPQKPTNYKTDPYREPPTP